MIIIGSDHSGVELKRNIEEYLNSKNIAFLDVSKENKIDDDYPDIAKNICDKVLKSEENRGIAICGTGIGICIACNKIKGIRAANCINAYMAELSRKHNDANVICFGARLYETSDFKNVKNMIDIFLTTSFEGDRHIRRIEKINELER